MFLRKKAQSTAEYAITIGLVIAVTAGVLQMALKGGLRQKNKQAVNYLLNAGNEELGSVSEQQEQLFSQDYRTTTVKKDDYVDESIMEKGGGEKKMQRQTTQSSAVNVELIDAVNPPAGE